MTPQSPPFPVSKRPLRLDEHYEDFYSTAPGDWRTISAMDKAANIMRMYQSLTGSDTVGSIVDIGCGEGAVASRLAQNRFFRHLSGFDLSRRAVTTAATRQLTGTIFAVFDGQHIPVRQGAVDLAVLSHVVEHLENPRLLLAEAARIAKYVFVEVPLEYTARTPRHFTWNATGHINLYNPLLVRHLLETVGLNVVAETVTCPSYAVHRFNTSALKALPTWAIKRLLLRISPKLATTLFAYHGALLATP